MGRFLYSSKADVSGSESETFSGKGNAGTLERYVLGPVSWMMAL